MSRCEAEDAERAAGAESWPSAGSKAELDRRPRRAREARCEHELCPGRRDDVAPRARGPRAAGRTAGWLAGAKAKGGRSRPVVAHASYALPAGMWPSIRAASRCKYDYLQDFAHGLSHRERDRRHTQQRRSFPSARAGAPLKAFGRSLTVAVVFVPPAARRQAPFKAFAIRTFQLPIFVVPPAARGQAPLKRLPYVLRPSQFVTLLPLAGRPH